MRSPGASWNPRGTAERARAGGIATGYSYQRPSLRVLPACNQIGYDAKQWEAARDLYEKCLALDPTYARAWARLGRVHRALSIYTTTGHAESNARAQDAFRRASRSTQTFRSLTISPPISRSSLVTRRRRCCAFWIGRGSACRLQNYSPAWCRHAAIAGCLMNPSPHPNVRAGSTPQFAPASPPHTSCGATSIVRSLPTSTIHPG